MNESDYKGPVRLQRKIPWGKRDKATGFAVCENIRDTMPPIVLDWHPKMHKTMETLSHDKVHVLRVDDLRDVVASKRAHVVFAPPATGEPLSRKGNRLFRILPTFSHECRVDSTYPKPETL